MSDLWNRYVDYVQKQSAAQIAETDKSIAKAEAFWNRIDAIKDFDNSRNGAYHEFMKNSGYNPDAIVPDFARPGIGPALDPSNALINKVIDKVIDSGNGTTNDAQTIAPVHNPTTGKDWEDTGVQPQVFDFLNADLAKHYGMSKTTAYQEALANTSYQRAVKDMQAAGLNPASLFGSGKGGPASGSVYASSPSGGSSGRSYGSKSSDDKLFDSGVYGALSAIGGLVGIAATRRPDGFWIGSAVSQGAMQLMNYVDKFMDKFKR